ncbi:MAG TPA: ExbD/TolR family protein [Burkholderiaceae bacterium]|jgi:biopolymer transport protein TolR|nr:ExbD/TolR family protein [Burkholderiaceae bacterium]
MARNSTMRGGRPRQFKAEINVVPYIDVMLVLLIIFMVAAPLTNPGVINLPKAEKSALPPPEYIQITLKVDSSATVGLKGQTHGNNEIQNAADRAALISKLRSLHAENAEMPLMIAAEKDIKYDDVIQVFSEAKKLGINHVGLVTKQ